MDVYTRAKQLGIQTEFVDGQGHRHVTDAKALKIILNALPERIPSRLLDGPVVIRAGEASRTEFSPAAALPVAWKVVAGQKIVAQGEASRRTIALAHRLAAGGLSASAHRRGLLERGSPADRLAAKGLWRRF